MRQPEPWDTPKSERKLGLDAIGPYGNEEDGDDVHGQELHDGLRPGCVRTPVLIRRIPGIRDEVITGPFVNIIQYAIIMKPST